MQPRIKNSPTSIDEDSLSENKNNIPLRKEKKKSNSHRKAYIFLGIFIFYQLFMFFYIPYKCESLLLRSSRISTHQNDLKEIKSDLLDFSTRYFEIQNIKNSSSHILLWLTGNEASVEFENFTYLYLFSKFSSIFCMDYPGFGNTPGRASEKNISISIKTMVEFIKKNNPTKKIVLGGWSFGGNLALLNGPFLKETISSVISISPFTSMKYISRDKDPTGLLTYTFYFRNSFFNAIDAGKKNEIPTLLMGSKEDANVPFDMADELYYNLMKNKKKKVKLLSVEKGDHFSWQVRGIKGTQSVGEEWYDIIDEGYKFIDDKI